MSAARDGASIAVLPDGRMLVTGGTDASGAALASAEILGQGPVESMTYARSGHASVVLSDGRVLITGGIAGSNAAEIFDPATGRFEIPTLALGQPRVGGTATLLNDGRVLLAGGDGSTLIEIFDPATGQVSNAGNMSAARSNHAATLLRDGRVVLAGGSDSSGALASVDIFDPETNTVSAGPALLAPRSGLSAITLMEQQVLISGGGTNTTEILDIAAGASAAGPDASSAHSVAVLLPNNNTVLMMGGASAAAEIYVPWTNSFQPFGTLAAARTGAPAGAAFSDLLQPGQARIAGGTVASGESSVASNAVESVQFPTVIPNKWDYQPGDTVHIYGAGFTPGAWVDIHMHEDPAPTDEHADIHPVQADATGRFQEDIYLVADHDLGVRFYLTATDSEGLTAGTTFTDSRNWSIIFAGTGTGSVTITPSSGTVDAETGCGGSGTPSTSQTVTSTCTSPGAGEVTTSANGATITFSATAGAGSTFAGWSDVANGSFSNCSGTTNPCSLVFGASGSITVTFNAADATPPTVTSINRDSATTTNLTTLTWTVTFSEAVTGVGTDDFALAATGSATGTISSVSADSGTTRTVTVTGVSGTGTLGLNLVDDDTIDDAAANKLGGTGLGNGNFTGQTYTVDNTAPTSTIDFPTATTYNAATWDAGCSTPGGDICGTSTDSGGSTLDNVKVSIKRNGSTNMWWDGDSFDAATETFFTATLGTAPNWSYGFPSSNFPAADSYTVHAKGTDALGNEESSPTVTFTFDATPPEVVSIARNDPAGEFTNASSVEFLVTFSEDVTGVSAADFALTTTGVAGASITSVSADSGSTRTVTVNTGTGDGTIRLDLDDDDSIVDAASNPLGGAGAQDFTTGEVYTIDKTAPVSIITFPANGAYYNTAGWNAGCATPGICGTSTEANTLTSVKVSIKRNGSTNLWWDSGDGGFDSPDEDFFEATVSGSAPSWSWSLAFPASNFPADDSYTVHAYGTDNAGNIETSPFATFTIDNTPPTVTVEQKAGQADPTNALPIEFTATFSETVTGFDASDVTVGWTGSGTPSVVISGTGPYNIAISGLTSSGTLTVSIGAATVKDLANNDNEASTSTDNEVLYDIDKPTSTISFPADGSLHNATTFAAGCTLVTIDTCGTAADTGGSGLKEVRVSILGPNGNYWDGAGYNNGAETWLLATGTTSWSRAFGLGVAGSYTIHARAEDNAGNLQDPVASATFTINSIPVVGNDGPKAATQYSDPINAVTISATDADGLPAGTGIVIDSTDWKLCTLALCADAYTHPGTLPGSLSLTPVAGGTEFAQSWTLSGNWTIAPGKYMVKVCVSDGLDVACTEVEIDISKEDARVSYTGGNFFQTAGTSVSTVSIPLSADIWDITAKTGDPAHDIYDGDIRNARVTFVNRDAGNAPLTNCANLTPVLYNPLDLKAGFVACNWPANIGSQDSVTFTIGIVVNNYYTRDGGDDNTTITVAKPVPTNFITGGGFLINLNSAGDYAGLTGAKTNFGFTVKYNKKLTNLQGNANIIVRATDGKVYQIKSNSTQSLTVNSGAGTATFLSKANLTDVTNPLAPIPIAGNLNLQLSIDDNGEPGNADTVAVTLRSANGTVLLFSSNGAGAAALPQSLSPGNGNGNVVVH
jgi:hypothetical protein